MFKRKIKMYAISLKSNPYQYLCYVEKKFQATEFILKQIRLEHNEHFESWCIVHELDKNKITSFYTYFEALQLRSEFNKYLITTLAYSKSDFAAVLRMFGKCVPIGCTFDLDIENAYYLGRLKLTNYFKNNLNGILYENQDDISELKDSNLKPKSDCDSKEIQ